jgi:N-acetylglucosaminyl-diphospho-decaprenol L-rhamnosyltransferase
MTKIDIVIVNWNSGNFLRNCINSVIKNKSEFVSSVIIVDNGSVDGSKCVENNGDLNIKIIELFKNTGFAKACNIGAKYCKSDLILFLNPDTLITDNTFPRVIKFLDRPDNAQIGVLGVKSIGQDNQVNRHCARIPNPLTLLFESTGLSRFSSIHFPPTALVNFDHETSCYVDHVIGAFYLVRAHLFKELGGFDERYFVYMEDIDFSYRLKKSGYKIYYMAEVSLFHQCGGSSKNVKAARLYYSLSSKLKFSKKWFNFWGRILVYISIIFVQPTVRMLFLISKRDLSGIRDLCLGYCQLFANILRII